MTTTDHTPAAQRRTWMRPTLERLRTMEAAVGTREVTGDGSETKTS